MTCEGNTYYWRATVVGSMDVVVVNEKLIAKTKEEEVKEKNWFRRLIWILLGIGVAAVIGIAVFVVLSLNRRGSEAKQTVMLLKKCLKDVNISTDMSELIIPSYSCNEEEFKILDLSEFKKLKRLEIGSYSFENVGKVRLNRLRELESIIVASHSFSNRPGVISVEDCNKLKEVVIGERAFSYFKGFEVNSVAKLSSIVIDNNCFGNVENIAFSEMPSLVNVTIGENSFIGKNGSFVLSDCDRLSTLRIGTGSFMNFTGFRIGSTSLVDLSIGSNCFRECDSMKLLELKRLERVSVGENSFSDKEGSFIAKNCPSLKELKISDYAFLRFKRLEFYAVPVLEVVEIGNWCFGNVNRVELHRMAHLTKWSVGGKSFYNGGDVFAVTECPMLRELIFGDSAFGGFESVVIRDLPSLEVLHIGSSAFSSAKEFKLESIPKLTDLRVGEGCFSQTAGRFILSNYSQLRAVRIGSSSFSQYSAVAIRNNTALELVELNGGSFHSMSSLEFASLLLMG